MTTPGVQFSGRLTSHGEARAKVIDADGHVVPVLVLHLASDSSLRLPLLVEQPFPAGHDAQCKAAARRYRQGQHVTVTATVEHLRLAVTADHIHTDNNEQAELPCLLPVTP